MLKIVTAAVAIALLPTLVTVSTIVQGSNPHAAPAPLLAASLPAFLMVGGGGAASWLLRRRRGNADVTEKTNKA
jgi:hypothetical protein